MYSSDSLLTTTNTNNQTTNFDKIKKYINKITIMGGEIIFFDVETTVPTTPGQRFQILEFGAIVVCPKKLIEIESYCTLIQPSDISLVPFKRFSGITRKAVSSAPTFDQVSDKIFQLLNGRVWAGHNIRRFDCHRIKEAFSRINKPAPKPTGLIDSLAVLGHEFGKRAGDLKMATLASYFGLGKQTHRSLDDVRMNLEVFKHCATVLLLESSLPQLVGNGSLSMVTRSRAGKGACGEEAGRKSGTMFGVQKAVGCKRVGLGRVVERGIEAFGGTQTAARSVHYFLRHARSPL